MADNDATISELIPATTTHIDDRLETSQVEGVGFVSRSITLDQVATHVAASDQIADVVSDAIDALPPPPSTNWEDIPGKPATFPPTVPIAWDDISGEPSTYPPSAHSHGAADLPAPPTTLPPSGTAGGDLSGSYPNPLIKPAVTNGHVLTTLAGVASWAAAAGGGASISIGVTPPGSPTAGALWWNSDAATGGGQLMIFYNDGSTTQWVPASPGMSTPTTPGGDFFATGTGGAILNGSNNALVPPTVATGNSGGWYNTSTGRYTPPAGRYSIFGWYTSSGVISSLYLWLYKNGVQFSLAGSVDAAVSGGYAGNPYVEMIVDANGTDYFELRKQADAGGVTVGFMAFGAFPLSGVKGPPGDPGVGLLQTVSYQTGAAATGTTIIPADNTIPQISEGNEYMTLAITPRSATSRLIIEVVTHMTNSFAGVHNMTAALFQDSTANALACSYVTAAQSAAVVHSFRHTMTSGTTSATTFRVRGGGNGAGTTTFNAFTYGGVLASSIVIQEVL